MLILKNLKKTDLKPPTFKDQIWCKMNLPNILPLYM
uniref:Uncharacterized protein n=1 Tax=Rhizophora mucronata TaxID=61149 RepID=A0A2P2PKM2_RHIMU